MAEVSVRLPCPPLMSFTLLPVPLSVMAELIVTTWSVTVGEILPVKRTSSRTPEVSVPPAVTKPRTAVVPIVVWLLTLFLRMPPEERLRTSVALVNSRLFVKPPAKRSKPVVVVPAGSVVVRAAVATMLVIEDGLKPTATPLAT